MSMDASALTHASRLGLLARRSPLLRLQGDDRLIALMRVGQPRAFEALVERYEARLLAFCRGMLASPEDAEDVFQEVLVAAHKAILADNRAINAKPWLYRIARNRCLNHLRKPVPEGQDSMDIHPHEHGESVAERVQNREEFRALIGDVHELPETQRTALLLREIEDLGYEEIAVAMDTTVPAVKSLLVRARMSLADSSQGRQLTCDEVHLELAEAAEGLRKASGPARAHMRGCERCREYRRELRRNRKALAALAPIGPFAALQAALTGKGVATAGGGGGAVGLGGAGAGTGAAGAGAGAGAAAAGGIGGTIATKAAVGVASLALLGAGASEIRSTVARDAGAGGASEAPARATIAMSGGAVAAGHHDSAGWHERVDAPKDDGRAGDKTESLSAPTLPEAGSEPASDYAEEPASPPMHAPEEEVGTAVSGPVTSGGGVVGPLEPAPPGTGAVSVGTLPQVGSSPVPPPAGTAADEPQGGSTAATTETPAR